MFIYRYQHTDQIHDKRPKCVSGDDRRMFDLPYSEPYAGAALRQHANMTQKQLTKGIVLFGSRCRMLVVSYI